MPRRRHFRRAPANLKPEPARSLMSRSLEEIRVEIDAIDTQLLELLNQRADLVHEVGEIKRKDGLGIVRPGA